MPTWEVCRIEERRDYKSKPSTSKTVAVVFTAEGDSVIGETPSFEFLPNYYTSHRIEIAKLIGKILAQGWEPVSYDGNGYVQVFRRQVP